MAYGLKVCITLSRRSLVKTSPLKKVVTKYIHNRIQNCTPLLHFPRKSFLVRAAALSTATSSIETDVSRNTQRALNTVQYMNYTSLKKVLGSQREKFYCISLIKSFLAYVTRKYLFLGYLDIFSKESIDCCL